MKILYHHRTASKDGQAVHIEEMVAALRGLGHDVRVVGPAGGDERMGGKVGWVHGLKSRLPKAVYELLELAYSAHAYRRLRAAAREFQPDVLYERYNLYLIAGVLLRWRHRIPLLLEVNSPLVFERSHHSGGLSWPGLARWAEQLAWRKADVVLPVTEVLAGHVRAYGVPSEHIAVIPNGINQEHFAAAPSISQAKAGLGLADRLVLGFTGFVREWHGVDRVIRWMAGEAAPGNVQLLIVGDGPVRTELEALALNLGLRQRVTFTGVLPREQVPALVAAFDIALQPAVVSYASPLKLMEYLALGKAIIAPRTPNLLEVLSDGENALMFDEQVNEDFENALTRLCADADMRNRLAAGAAGTIARLDLTWRGNARRVAQLGERLCSRASQP